MPHPNMLAKAVGGDVLDMTPPHRRPNYRTSQYGRGGPASGDVLDMTPPHRRQNFRTSMYGRSGPHLGGQGT